VDRPRCGATWKITALERGLENRRVAMRPVAILAACVLVCASAVPVAVQAQSSSSTSSGHSELTTMWEKFKGSWAQTKGAIKEQWGKLTDDDLMEIQGRREKLVGKIQTRYGIGHDQAEAQVSGWEHKQSHM
jgi:uncharacterized protein YjbJ (UPF0337 family)